MAKGQQPEKTIEELIIETSNALKQTLMDIGYLERQAATYGILSIPLKLHNDLREHREQAETLQLKLDQLLEQRPSRFHGAGNLIVPLPEEENVPSVLVIESDVHWGNIVTEVVTAMAHKVNRYVPKDYVDESASISLKHFRMAIIGQPFLEISRGEFSLEAWINQIIAISQAMPVILLTTRDAMSLSIQTRRSLLDHNCDTLDTIQKETFHYERFVKRVQQAIG
jgi:hypothetical protein